MSPARRAVALAFGAGALGGLAHAPLSFWPAGMASLWLGLILVLRAPTLRAAFLGHWALGFGWFLFTLSWIVHPFMVDVARHGWMAPFGLVGLAGGIALFWGAAGAFVHWVGGSDGRRALSWIVALGGVELLRSYLFTGFPWALVGYIWTDAPVAQLGAVVGPHGITLVTLILVAGGEMARRRASVGGGQLTLTGLALAMGFGFVMRGALLPEDSALTLRLVQPNAPQHQKWDPDFAWDFFERAVALSAEPGAGAAPDLIIWPETSVATLLSDAQGAMDHMAANAQGAPVIFGINRTEGARGYNAMVVMSPEATPLAIYDKHHLVPFGEYLPLPGLLTSLGLRAFTAQAGYGYSAGPGPGPRVLDLGPLGRVLPLICYEASFPQDLRSAARPDWLLQITNDAWFGPRIGPAQNYAHARMRAIETGLPMVRVANTGISTVFDARGQERARIAQGQAGFVDFPLPRALPETLYSRSGDMPLTILLVLGGGAFVTTRRRKAFDLQGARG